MLIDEISRRASRRDDEDECLELEECLEELEDLDDDFDDPEEEEEDFEDDLEDDDGTSRMLRTRPVVGSVVDDTAGS